MCKLTFPPSRASGAGVSYNFPGWAPGRLPKLGRRPGSTSWRHPPHPRSCAQIQPDPPYTFSQYMYCEKVYCCFGWVWVDFPARAQENPPKPSQNSNRLFHNTCIVKKCMVGLAGFGRKTLGVGGGARKLTLGGAPIWGAAQEPTLGSCSLHQRRWRAMGGK